MSLIVANCMPRVVSVDSSCGCTLTKASIGGLTPAALEDMQKKELAIATIICEAAEAKMLGVQESGMAMLIRSSIVDIKPALNTIKVGRQSHILPYIQRPQRSIMNANYFLCEAGGATPGAGTGGVPASCWRLTVNLGVSDWKSPLTNIERYFLPGMALYVLTWDNTSSKNARHLHFTVFAASNANAGGVEKAYVDVYPNVSAAAWAGYDAEQKAVHQPTFGVVQTGANNVSDRESWCYNQPQDISKKLLCNWLQTTRESFAIEQNYRETLALMLAGKINPFAKSFLYLPEAEQRKRAAMLSEEAWLRAVWYNGPISELQTPETYTQLPAVTDPLNPSCVKEYKANALGAFTLLTDCARVTDLNGEALDMDFLFQQLYYLKRYREADGDKIQVIDCMTDRVTAGLIRKVMAKYYNATFGWTTVKEARIGERITHDNQVMFNYDLYDIPDVPVQLAVFHDEHFDDHISAFPDTVDGSNVGFKARGRNLWFIDWSDFKVGLGKTNSVVRKHPDAATHELYRCVIQADVTEYNLRSKEWTVFLDRPHRHLLIHNFSAACPTIAVSGCSVPNRLTIGT